MTIEPQLQLHDIQGMVLPGFLKPHQALIYLPVPGSGETLGRLCAELQGMLTQGAIASGRTTLHDRRRFRRGRTSAPLVGLGFSSTGLDKLSSGLNESVPSPAFRLGMRARAGLLGDAPSGAGWHATFGGKQPDALLVVAGNSSDEVQAQAAALSARLAQVVGEDALPSQLGNTFDNDLRGREHFGFADGISQPGIRGRHNRGPKAFITRRHLPQSDAEHDLFGLPGQHLVWPGEFVLGYPASSPDPRIPGPVRPVPGWMHNGSFLVYRRLRQDVAGFRIWLHREAEQLQEFPGFAHLNPAQRAQKLAAKLVGRWPDGAPLARAPDNDIPALGRDRRLNNDFRFDDDTPEREPLPPPPRAVADSLGVRCPVSAHIRKVNVRDQASDAGGTSATYTRRLLRVGVPYGDPLPECFTAEQAQEDRGLLFLSIQASIEDQFEFLQSRWINSDSRPRAPGGHDMLVGQNAATPDGIRRCRLFGQDISQQAEIRSETSFVHMTGGGYFFVPSLRSLAWLLAQGRKAG